ncbi:uncharacterized protein Dvir_GJ25680, isoform A [Drosophila virilis]|uniref:Uncharacterized protein, isoform A n=1 Tax=Drosophila virilis TaxID=7244 RepID=A0A0Q9WF16_DROVI|nr:uncharacterized protein Dvir_GJ25680, isoform A [Drosophila virilis]
MNTCGICGTDIHIKRLIFLTGYHEDLVNLCYKLPAPVTMEEGVSGSKFWVQHQLEWLRYWATASGCG